MLFKVQIDRSQSQYFISTEVDRNTPLKVISFVRKYTCICIDWCFMIQFARMLLLIKFRYLLFFYNLKMHFKLAALGSTFFCRPRSNLWFKHSNHSKHLYVGLLMRVGTCTWNDSQANILILPFMKELWRHHPIREITIFNCS